MKFDIKKLTKIYLFVYAVGLITAITILSVYLNTAPIIGEWDDYTLPIASIFNDKNFSITDSDILKYKEIFPRWGTEIDIHYLSGQYARNGGELTWYFPTYAIACIPFVAILKLLNLQTEYAFSYTNIVVLMASLVVVYRYLNVDIKKKAILILMLSINTINLYIYWPSAEVFMYSFIVMSLVFWYNKEYKRAAIFISIAGMLNPTIMSIGLIMIGEYLFNLYRNKKGNESIIQFIKKNFIEIVSYGCCYIIGLIPLIYNYYQIGYINLTAASGYGQGKETTISRFWAYIFDLNFGYLPYYSLVLVIAVILFVLAIIKKQYRYNFWIVAFIINTFIYSKMAHINCGMAGIARYNAWCVAILIFAVCLFFEQIVNHKKIRNIINILLICSTVLTGLITFTYGIFRINPRYMTPIATYVLDKAPALYNPLHSTFNSRVNHIDGGYTYDTPVVYTADDGYIRKILATEKDKDTLLTDYMSMSEYNDWFADEVNKLTDKETYINIPSKYQIVPTATQ